MSFHIEITANDELRTVVYSADVEDVDVVEGSPVQVRIAARTAAFGGEGALGAEAKPGDGFRWWGRKKGRR